MTDETGRTEDAALAWLLVVAGTVPVAYALIVRATWGAEPTLGLFLLAFGVTGLARLTGATGPRVVRRRR
jgi:hypothetical protein